MAGAKGLTAAAKLLTAGAVVAGVGGAAFLFVSPGSMPGAAPDIAQESPDAPDAQAGSDAAQAESAPEAAADAADDPAPGASAAPEPPEFDLVRVSPDGSTLVAGRADPGVDVAVTIEGEPAAQTVADGQGNFVAMFSLAPSDQPRAMELQAQDAGGTRLAAHDTVIVAPRQVRADTGAAPSPTSEQTAVPMQTPEAGQAADAGDTPGRAVRPRADEHAPEERRAASTPATEADAPSGAQAAEASRRAAAPETSEPLAEPAPPALFVASEDGIRVMHDTAPGDAPQVMDNIVVDAISYGSEGDVALAGRGAGSDPATVRIYIDDHEISMAPMAPDGNWRAELPDIDPGIYSLRVDQIDAGGAVESRFETPFQRESPEQIARLRPDADGHARSGAVTVQPGYTLWGISRSNYGRGILYVQVFEENREQIRDPDLIYPGQVFDIPEIARDEIEALP